MYDKCYFCLDQLPKLKKESTASFFVNFGGAGVQKSRPTLLYKTPLPRHDHLVQDHYQPNLTIDTHLASRCQLKQKGTKTFFCRGNPANHHKHGTKRQLTMGEKQMGPKQAIDPRIIFGPIVCILINRK